MQVPEQLNSRRRRAAQVGYIAHPPGGTLKFSMMCFSARAMVAPMLSLHLQSRCHTLESDLLQKADDGPCGAELTASGFELAG